MDLLEQLNWRYATKQMNGSKVAPEKINAILEAIRLAPTAYGLQPFHVFVVKNQDVKDRIHETSAPNQPQIPKSSHLLIFAANRKVTPTLIDEYFGLIRSTRNLPEEKLSAYRARVEELMLMNDDESFSWAAKQAYIALGFALVAAAKEHVDSVPIEGFSPEKLDNLLHLPERNLGSVCMMAIGYRDELTDSNAKLPKVRKSSGNLFEELNLESLFF